MARRELKITYGSYVVGYGQSKRHPDGPVDVELEQDDARVAFTLVIAGATSASDLQTELDAAKSAYGTPNQRLRVQLVNAGTGAVEATLVDLQPDSPSRTALDVRPRILPPPGDDGRSARSDVLRVEIRAGRIASYDSDHARQDVRFTVDYSGGRRRTVTVTGTFTATAGAGALATYQAGIDNLTGPFLTALGGNYQSVPQQEQVTPDKEDHVCAFRRVFRERLGNEVVGTLDDPDVNDQSLIVSVGEVGVEGDAKETPLRPVSAQGVFWIDSTSSTALLDLWESKIRPWIVQNMEDLAGSAVYVTREEPGIDPEENVLRPRVEGVAQGGGALLFRRVRTDDETRYGWIFRPIWPTEGDADAPGDPDPAYTYRGPKVILRTVEVVTRTVGGTSVSGGLPGAPKGAFPVLSRSSRAPRWLGLPGDSQLGTEDRTVTLQWRIVAPVRDAGGGRGRDSSSGGSRTLARTRSEASRLAEAERRRAGEEAASTEGGAGADGGVS